MTERLPVRLTGLEKSLFVFGAAVAAGLVTQAVLLGALFGWDLFWGLVRGFSTELFLGREGGIPTYLAWGVPPLLVFQFSFAQDVAAGFLVYPFFLHALHKHHNADNVLMRRLRRIEAAAARHRNLVDRWGAVGVFLFMLAPFLVNGPLVGLMVGRVAAIRTRYLVAPVVLATGVAAAAWTFAYGRMLALAERFDPGFGKWIAVAVALILAALMVWESIQDRAHRLREQRADEEE